MLLDEAESNTLIICLYKPHFFASWTLNSDDEWEAPIAEPAAEEGKIHTWNEENQQWDTTDKPY